MTVSEVDVTRVYIELSALGDINDRQAVELRDAIPTLQMLSGMPLDGSVPTSLKADVNEDGRLGMADLLYILQKVAGMR